MRLSALLFQVSAACAAVIADANYQAILSAPDSISSQRSFTLDYDALRLVEFEEQEPRWITEREKLQARAQGIGFFDITDTPNLGATAHLRLHKDIEYPKSPNATEVVNWLFPNIETKNMKENLEKLTSFYTRYYYSETGRQSQRWLLSKISNVTSTSASDSLKDQISITEFVHPWGQNSILVKINGSSTDDDRVIIVGAHQDSINRNDPFARAPGADDDGSGTVTTLEAYRVLIASGIRPKIDVEFHWYAAEEGGLLGSQAVALDYASRDINVYAMNQIDMTAWVEQGVPEVIAIVTTSGRGPRSNTALFDFNKMLIEEYLTIGWVESGSTFASSDDASWAKAGYNSGFMMENTFEKSNHHVHTPEDRIYDAPEFSFEHMANFAKVVIAFVGELAL